MSSTIGRNVLELAQLPECECSADRVRARVPCARRVIVLDDDPTGTQTVRDLPVLTRWTIEDLRWAIRLATPAIFVMTNSRSLSPGDAAVLNRQVAERCFKAAAAEGIDIAFASRSDSTLRGHFPLEPDTLAEVSAAVDRPIDGVLVIPAYTDAGRVTVGGLHCLKTATGLMPVTATDYAADATFGYRNAYLPAWIEEKSGGRIPADQVVTVSLSAIRSGGIDAVADLLAGVRGLRCVVVDAITDNDLRIIAAAVLRTEAKGRRFIYRVGPSFVRARCGQEPAPPLRAEELRALFGAPSASGGLVVVGSHVELATRQLSHLRQHLNLTDIEVDVATAIDPKRRERFIGEAVDAVATALPNGHVVLASTRTVHLGSSPTESLQIARRVSVAIARIVAGVVAIRRPAFVVAKGGITSADVATLGLSINRSWVRGTVLDGIVSVWQPIDGRAPGLPYVVFAGNVGSDDALTHGVDRLAAVA